MLETSQMQRLVAVADHDTITEAAESLYLTQPALSRALRKIEVELGVELFERGPKNEFSFNETGLKAVEWSRDILKRIEAVERRLREDSPLGDVVVVGACTPPALWSASPRLADEFPDTVFSSVINDTAALETALFEGDIAIGFVSKPIDAPEHLCFPWAVEHLYAILPEGHPLHDASSVMLEELDGQTFLVQDHVGDWLGVLQKQTPHSRILLQEDRATLMGVARKSSLPRFMSNMTMSFDDLLPGEVAVPVRGAGSELRLWCACRRDLAAGIVDVLRNHADELASGGDFGGDRRAMGAEGVVSVAV